MKTGADSLVTVKDSQLTAAEDLTISSKVKSEIGSETGGALGVGINVGIADVSSKVEIQGTSALTAGKDLAISAEGSNAIDLQRQGSAEDLPIAIDLGWAEAKTDASVNVEKEATLKAKENVDVSAKAERNLSVEVENSSGDGTLGLAVGVIQSETKATADVQGKVYANGKVSVSAENTVSDEDGKYDPDTLHITSESESDDGTSSDPIHDIVDVATTKGNQLMAGIKKLWGDKSTEKKAADAGTTAADQTAATSAGGGLGLNAATAFLFSDNSAKASLSGEVRGYDGASGAGAVDVHAETLSRTKVKAGVSQGADKSAGIAALTVHQKNTAEATVEDGVTVTKAKDVSVTAENKDSNLSMVASGGKGQTVAIDGTVNVNRFENTTKATVGKATINTDGDVSVSAEDNSKTINIGGAIAVSE